MVSVAASGHPTCPHLALLGSLPPTAPLLPGTRTHADARSRERAGEGVLRDQPAHLRQAEAAPPEDLPIYSLLGAEERG